jgi:hypothetical protein
MPEAPLGALLGASRWVGFRSMMEDDIIKELLQPERNLQAVRMSTQATKVEYQVE